ncbi:MAG: polysaccharide deacetylase family protein [Clostridiales bacterium]|nr:polysaccharide deacetylase family protein [Clostridiales bacterium]
MYEFKEAVPQNRFVPAEQEEEAGETASSQQVIRQETGVELPVLMYHDILNDPAKQGPYAITPAELEADLKYLQNNGYTAISIDDLIQYYEQQVPLPEKPVLLTFDDGHYNNIYYAQPLLEQYDMQAVAFIVGAYCDRAEEEQDENPNYSYVTWSRVQEMSQSGVWDIQSHTWNMHDLSAARQGVWQQSGESDAAYRQALTEDFTAITDKITEVTGTRPTAFAYPFGYLSDEAEEVLKSLGYKATFSCRESVSTIQPGQEDTMYNICRYLRASGISAQELLEQ